MFAEITKRRLAVGVTAVAAVVGALFVAIPSADASPAVVVTPTFPATTSVGQTGLAASLAVTNNSTSPDDTANITLSTIAVVPSCGSATFVGNANCPSASADPGVFRVSAGTGDAASACAGTTFTVKTTDTTTGRVAFTASSAVVLGQNATCTIDFTVDVLKFPVHPLSTSDANTATTEQFAYVAGTNTLNHPVAGTGSTSTVVAKAAPSITTTASAGITIGGSVTDQARLSNGASPTGTITFALYGPNDPTCRQTAAFTATNNVGRGNATYTSAAFTPAPPGTYNWVATYNGDGGNATFTEPCGSTNESVSVNQFAPSLTTQASAGVVVGADVTDTATLSGGGAGGLAPTGTITFTAYGPDDPTCAGTVAFTSTVTVSSGNGSYTSAAFGTPSAGTYTWAASYSGDTNNADAVDGCGATNESVTVAKAIPSVTSQASVPEAGQIADSATVTGGFTPTGTVTFTAYGPGDPTCAKAAAFTTTVPLGSGGQESSGAFTVTKAGTYVWVAHYDGDANNNASADACGQAAETVTIPMIVTTTGLPDATIGVAYKQKLAASGGKKSYHWSVVSGSLPAGLKLSAGGALTGKATSPGVSQFVIQLTDSSKPANVVTRALSITVEPMTVATTSLPGGLVGKAYKAKLAFSGGFGTHKWTVVSGALPPGLKLSAAGALSGKPTTAGSYTITVQVVDSAKPAHNVAQQTLTITVN